MEDKIKNNYLELNALKVKQPLGDFYVVSISAEKLLEVAFSEPLKYIDSKGNVQGSQRVRDEKRLKEIASYIETVEMAFPNSIILSANYNQFGILKEDDLDRWRINTNEDGSIKLIIPRKVKLAAIIDGQHRLNAFDFVKDRSKLKDIELLCSVYFDLPNSYQAFLFATINSNQKKVDRSLALEQFGYNVDDEPAKAWTPEKFAVFISRKLNTDKDTSKLYKHIKVAPLNVDKLFLENVSESWVVSTATIVDGVTSLISTNPKRDRVLMQHKNWLSGRSRELISEINDPSPLRFLFLNLYDQKIYDIITEYFKVIDTLYWQKAPKNSYIIKTVGIQALFDVLKGILKSIEVKPETNIDFKSILKNSETLDFSDRFFQSSGIGRSRLRNAINLKIGNLTIDKIKKVDVSYYEQILNSEGTSTHKEKWFWEEEAENSVIYALQNATWNFDNNSVSIVLDDNSDEPVKFESYEKFIQKLEEIAELAFVVSLPSDHEFAEEQREKFDESDLVQSCLVEYEENLKKIGWT
jgi:DNA phosphorothioation-associated DGQHR protein 1